MFFKTINRKEILLIPMAIILLLSTAGQETLKIGDKVPDLFIPNIKQYKKEEINLSEFRGKLVILSFWLGACKGCVKQFAKLETLQKQFGERIQIMLVNFESFSKINKTFEKWIKISPLYKLPELPLVVEDSVLHKLFGVKYYPHEVWIDENGILVSATGAEEVNSSNISMVLDHGDVKMNLKSDNLTFDPIKNPVMGQLYCDDPGAIKYYSALLKYVPGIHGGGLAINKDASNRTIRISRVNQSIPQLFSHAATGGLVSDPYKQPKFDFGKRVILHVKDSSRYFYRVIEGMSLEDWRKRNCFTYELVIYPKQRNELYKKMLSDLQEFFNITCRIEKRKMKCLALVRTSDNDRIHSYKKPLDVFDARKDTSQIQIYNGFISSMVNCLSEVNANTTYVFFDKTGYKERVDIEFKKDLLIDFAGLRRLLNKKYDLDLIDSVEELDVLVISENDRHFD